MTEENKMPFYAKTALILLAIVLVTLILYYTEIVFAPLVFALFGAILLNPAVNFLSRKIPRLVSIFMALILALTVTAGMLVFIGFQFSMFSKTYPQLKEKYKTVSGEAISWSAQKFNVEDSTVTSYISSGESQMLKSVTGEIGPTILSVSSGLIALVLIPVYIFLILYYKPLLLEFIRKLFNSSYHKTVVEVLDSVKAIIQSYLVGLLIEGAIVAVLNSVSLLILGVEYAILLGVTGAILNVIPYIGGITAIALPMIVAFVTKSWVTSLLVLGAYTIIQFIDNHYLIPYIVASKVKVNALVAIVVVIIGDLIWGVPGMFLSIPLTALIKVICDHIDSLKPYGILLGDNIPSVIRLPFSRVRNQSTSKK